MSIQSINHVQLAFPAGAEAPIRRFYASLLGLPEVRLQAGNTCLLYTSPSPRDLSTSRMPSSA